MSEQPSTMIPDQSTASLSWCVDDLNQPTASLNRCVADLDAVVKLFGKADTYVRNGMASPNASQFDMVTAIGYGETIKRCENHLAALKSSQEEIAATVGKINTLYSDVKKMSSELEKEKRSTQETKGTYEVNNKMVVLERELLQKRQDELIAEQRKVQEESEAHKLTLEKASVAKLQSLQEGDDALRQQLQTHADAKELTRETVFQTKLQSLQEEDDALRLRLQAHADAKEQTRDTALTAKMQSLQEESDALRQKLQDDADAKQQRRDAAFDAKQQTLQEGNDALRQGLQEESVAKQQRLETVLETEKQSLKEGVDALRQKLQDDADAKRQTLESAFEAKTQSLQEGVDALRQKLLDDADTLRQTLQERVDTRRQTLENEWNVKKQALDAASVTHRQELQKKYDEALAAEIQRINADRVAERHNQFEQFKSELQKYKDESAAEVQKVRAESAAEMQKIRAESMGLTQKLKAQAAIQKKKLGDEASAKMATLESERSELATKWQELADGQEELRLEREELATQWRDLINDQQELKCEQEELANAKEVLAAENQEVRTAIIDAATLLTAAKADRELAAAVVVETNAQSASVTLELEKEQNENADICRRAKESMTRYNERKDALDRQINAWEQASQNVANANQVAATSAQEAQQAKEREQALKGQVDQMIKDMNTVKSSFEGHCGTFTTSVEAIKASAETQIKSVESFQGLVDDSKSFVESSRQTVENTMSRMDKAAANMQRLQEKSSKDIQFIDELTTVMFKGVDDIKTCTGSISDAARAATTFHNKSQDLLKYVQSLQYKALNAASGLSLGIQNWRDGMTTLRTLEESTAEGLKNLSQDIQTMGETALRLEAQDHKFLRESHADVVKAKNQIIENLVTQSHDKQVHNDGERASWALERSLYERIVKTMSACGETNRALAQIESRDTSRQVAPSTPSPVPVTPSRRRRAEEDSEQARHSKMPRLAADEPSTLDNEDTTVSQSQNGPSGQDLDHEQSDELVEETLAAGDDNGVDTTQYASLPLAATNGSEEAQQDNEATDTGHDDLHEVLELFELPGNWSEDQKRTFAQQFVANCSGESSDKVVSLLDLRSTGNTRSGGFGGNRACLLTYLRVSTATDPPCRKHFTMGKNCDYSEISSCPEHQNSRNDGLCIWINFKQGTNKQSPLENGRTRWVISARH